jgi:glycosyltransferase involved in cell wall biosynthesis
LKREPKISVLLPVFNAERYLRRALESVLTQTFEKFEVVAVNDGSTDRSKAILDEYSRADTRLHQVSQDNQGIVSALNAGLELMRGEYVARMDADDVAMPHRLERQLAYMDRHPECVAVGSQVIYIDPDGDEIGPKADLKESHEEINTALLAGGWPIVHPSVMIRTSTIRQIGGYQDYRTWEDHDLFLRLAEVGRLANLDEPLLRYRLHLGSIVHQRAAAKSNVLANVLQDARRRRGLPAMQEQEVPKYRGLTQAEHERNWVWWALAGGNPRTARKHAWRVVRGNPWSCAAWRAMCCSIRGR